MAGVEVHWLVEDLSTDEPRVTNAYRGHLPQMPEADEFIEFLATTSGLVPSTRRRRIRRAGSSSSSSDEWTAEDEEAMVAAGFEFNGHSEYYVDGHPDLGVD